MNLASSSGAWKESRDLHRGRAQSSSCSLEISALHSGSASVESSDSPRLQGQGTVTQVCSPCGKMAPHHFWWKEFAQSHQVCHFQSPVLASRFFSTWPRSHAQAPSHHKPHHHGWRAVTLCTTPTSQVSIFSPNQSPGTKECKGDFSDYPLHPRGSVP